MTRPAFGFFPGISFDMTGLSGWDSGLLTFLKKAMEICGGSSVRMDTDGRTIGPDRRCKTSVGNTVNVTKATWKNTIGDQELITVRVE